MKRGLIVTGGRVDLAFAAGFLRDRSFDCVVAVDGGLEAVKALQVIPDAVVGDFDTVDPKVLAEYREKPGILWDVHQAEKDETDTELAINTALALGCRELTMLGATGGRMDHAIGNIHLMAPCLEKGIEAFIVDEKNRISLIKEGRSFHRDRLWGSYLSFLPLTEEVKGITLTGFKYPLTDRDIRIGTSLCISNELIEDEGRIEFSQGILICVESHD